MEKNNILDFSTFDTKEVNLESYKNFKTSFFKDVFEKAYVSVEEIIGHIKEDAKDDKREINNIIAFTGERGTGKTTAMLSFANYLKKDIRDDDEWKPDSKIKSYRFECVPLIDPSKLTKDENIITLVVAYIYESIKKIAHDESAYSGINADSYLEKLKTGVRKCQEIYNVVCVKYTSFNKNIEQNPDTVETFSDIAKATRLRELTQELVDIYLDILSHEKGSKKSILIIPIDDLDTNIRNAYTLVEDLRSYFMVSKVIIMMAVKMEQLNDALQLKFCEDFKNLSTQGQRMDSGAETMATKYLEKLIVHDRRIAMPSLTFQNLGAYGVKTPKLVEEAECALPKVIEKERPVVDYVLSMLYQNTGIILVKNEQGVHEFIPRNLRTLHQLLQILEEQKPVSLQEIKATFANNKKDELSEQQQILKSNLEKIYSFLLDNSTSGNMSSGLVEILRRIGQQPIDMMNAFLVRNLCEALESDDARAYIRNNPVIASFTSPSVHPDLITIGDVLYLLNEVERAGSESGIRQFVTLVKMIYSITMLRLLFVQEREPKYSDSVRLLGRTICNPNVQLLPGDKGNNSYEWMPRIRGERICVRTGQGVYTLDGKRVEEDGELLAEGQAWNVLSIETTVRMGFYVLGYHRMKRIREERQIDPHVYEPGDYPLLKYRRSAVEDINSALLAFHWMSFVSLSLTPEDTVKAMLHYLHASGLFESNAYKQLMGKIENWRRKNICAIPIYSIDIINELINDMHQKRFEYDDGTAREKRLHGYLYFMDSLKASLQSVLERASNDDDGRKEIMTALNECPVLFQTQDDKVGKVEEELKWLNE